MSDRATACGSPTGEGTKRTRRGWFNPRILWHVRTLPANASPPLLYHADELDVRAWRLERV